MAADIQITDNSAQVLAQLERNIGAALEQLGMKWQEIVTVKEISENKWDWPHEPSPRDIVDSGHLRRNMTYRVNIADQEVKVGTDVEYALAVEYGAAGKPGRPFMKNSVENYREEYEKIIKDNLGDGFNLK